MHLRPKFSDIIVNPTFPYWKLLFLKPVLVTISETVLPANCWNFVEICNIYANQLV